MVVTVCIFAHAVGQAAPMSASVFNDGLFLYCVIHWVITGKPQCSRIITDAHMALCESVTLRRTESVGLRKVCLDFRVKARSRLRRSLMQCKILTRLSHNILL